MRFFNPLSRNVKRVQEADIKAIKLQTFGGQSRGSAISREQTRPPRVTRGRCGSTGVGRGRGGLVA